MLNLHQHTLVQSILRMTTCTYTDLVPTENRQSRTVELSCKFQKLLTLYGQYSRL